MSIEPRISVKGVAELRIPPDMTVIVFDLSALNYRYAEAIEELNRRVDDLRKALHESGTDPKKLKTTSFSVDAEHEYIGKKHVFKGWRAHHGLRLELPVDRDTTNHALQAITTACAEAKFSVRFEVRDKAGKRAAVLAEATRTARMNAEAIASAGGCRLGRVVSMEYGWSDIRFGSIEYELESSRCVADADAMPGPDIEPEEVEARDSVTVVWELLEG